MEFTCRYCGRKHRRTGQMIDEFIRCECGYQFYAYSYMEMTFTTSADDMYKEKAVLAFKWFLAQTGRWRDEEAEEAILNHILNSVDSLGVLETGLELYQGETIGKCLLNCGDIASVCKSLAKKQDVMLKNKGDYIDIIELQPKKKPKEKPPFAGEPVAYLNEEYRLKGWQKETMEEDAARAGYLFGEPG